MDFTKQVFAYGDKSGGLILWYKYDKIKDYAIDSNLLILENNRYKDVTGRKENPYAENIAFSAAPFISRIDGYSVRFLFSNEFIFTNTGDVYIKNNGNLVIEEGGSPPTGLSLSPGLCGGDLIPFII